MCGLGTCSANGASSRGSPLITFDCDFDPYYSQSSTVALVGFADTWRTASTNTWRRCKRTVPGEIIWKFRSPVTLALSRACASARFPNSSGFFSSLTSFFLFFRPCPRSTIELSRCMPISWSRAQLTRRLPLSYYCKFHFKRSLSLSAFVSQGAPRHNIPIRLSYHYNSHYCSIIKPEEHPGECFT